MALAFASAAPFACHPTRGVDDVPNAANAANHGGDASRSVVALATVSSSDASTAVQQAPSDVATTVQFLADGTLIATGTETLLARAPTPTPTPTPTARAAVKRLVIGKTTMAQASPELAGLVLRGETEVTLLATPSLDVLYRGASEPAMGTGNAVSVGEPPQALLQFGGKLLRLSAPKSAPALGPVETVRLLLSQTRINVTYTEGASALFDQNGTLLGEGVPLPAFPRNVPRGGVAGDVAYRVTGSRLARIDLKTGKATRATTVRCKKDEELGNPTPSPNGELLVVTCGGDGVVLDGRTLVERRRIDRVMPGCDNWPMLSGRFLPDNRTLLLEGCGGEAKLDASTGRYQCGDAPGVLGAPYMMMMGQNVPAAPTGRDKLPLCNADGQANRVGRGVYSFFYGEKISVKHAGGGFELEDGAGLPALSPDESVMAYVRGALVIVRALPSGKILEEIPFVAPGP